MDSEYISASDLERYGYCPLSWWLGRAAQADSESLRKGTKDHERISDDLKVIMTSEERALSWEKIVLLFASVATLLAVLGFILFSSGGLSDWGWLLTILSIFWIFSALLLMYNVSFRSLTNVTREQKVTIAGIVIMVLVLNAATLFHVSTEVAAICEVLALIWLIAASMALYVSLTAEGRAKKVREQVHIDGKLLYIGTEDQRLLVSHKYKLTGRPDYILMVGDEAIPVDLKTGRQPRGPLFSHILQIGAYCLLLSDERGKRVSRGILKYGDVEHEIDFDEELENLLLLKMAEMHACLRTGNVHRNHNRPGKCAGCSRRDLCPERLA